MDLIETHAHIYDEQFDLDREAMLERAFATGIKEIWMPNCASETIDAMLALESKYPNICKAMMGLHPCYVNESYKNELEIVSEYLSKRDFIMIGEIGLDYYWDLNFVAQQEEAFLYQLALAKKYNLPICIHSRNSKDNYHNAIIRCCELIESFAWEGLRGIFHCFSGSLEEAKRVISLNFMLGIGGVATFKNGGMDNILPEISLNSLVLETDAPYLAPVPYRGKRNEVMYIDLVAHRISEIKQVHIKEVKHATSQNALQLINKL